VCVCVCAVSTYTSINMVPTEVNWTRHQFPQSSRRKITKSSSL